MHAIMVLASWWSPTPAERLENAVSLLFVFVVLYCATKNAKALWAKAPDELKSAAKGAVTNKAVGLIQKWFR